MFAVTHLLPAAAVQTEADGVVEVTKQLEKQVIEDKEKEEDGEEGKYLTFNARMEQLPFDAVCFIFTHSV